MKAVQKLEQNIIMNGNEIVNSNSEFNNSKQSNKNVRINVKMSKCTAKTKNIN